MHSDLQVLCTRKRRRVLCHHSMLVVWPLARTENRVQRGETAGVGIRPGIHLRGLDRNNAAIVAGCRDLRGWLIGNRRKGKETRLLFAFPPGLQTRHKHVDRRIRPEFFAAMSCRRPSKARKTGQEDE